MNAILIEGDAKNWFESGSVCDVLIRKNVFVDCAYGGGPGNAVIVINPSNPVVDASSPVYRNIRVEDNVFKTFDYPILYAKSVGGLVFKNNTIIRTKTMAPRSGNKYTFYLNGCKDVVIHNNSFEDYVPEQLVVM